jgi:hypothetical protein
MKKILIWFLFLGIVLSLNGCATLRRKFVRKKKKKEGQKVILALEDYDKLIDYHELYKKHYLLWQYWHDELIGSLEKNYKKQRVCADQVLEHLNALKKYITPDKAEILIGYIQRVEKIRNRLYGRSLNEIERARISRELEKLKRLIDKEFRYSEIKSYIVAPPSQQEEKISQ